MKFIHALLAFSDKLFNKHQLVRRCSITAAWVTLLYIMVFTFEHAGQIQEPVADVLKRLIEVSAAVVLFYHYRKQG